ncbi:MAG: hypothetical protein IH583_06430, partial [Candidatus Aminicenantes bacterium]|nr:hypothetical protein [Candidatus Aminicenantes bacterium]
MNTFDLEHAIAEWKITLRRNPALEDGHVAELEACLRDEIEELVGQGAAPEEAFLKAVSAMGRAADAGPEFYKAHRSRRSARPSWQPPRFIPSLFWSYIQVALRKIKRQKGYSFINIASLAVGLACSVLMMLWVGKSSASTAFMRTATRSTGWSRRRGREPPSRWTPG